MAALRREQRAAKARRLRSTSKRRRRARATGTPTCRAFRERVNPGRSDDVDALQSPDGGPPAATFWNLGAGVRGGLPFTPLAAMLRDERMADNQKDNPERGACRWA
jgi:hypothetical protein